MPETTKKRSWSFSALLDYETCPFRIAMKEQRAPRPEVDESSPLVRGIKVHDMAEKFVKGELDELPHELRKFREDFERERELYAEGKVIAEDDWGYDEEWNPCGWSEAWLRMKLDLMEFVSDDFAKVTDYKTGKRFGNEVKHTQQGQLYMIGSFLRYPELESIDVHFRYLDEGKDTNKVYQRNQLQRYLERFQKRAERMCTDEVLKAKPTRGNCRFCDYGVNKGTGACPYAIPWEM